MLENETTSLERFFFVCVWWVEGGLSFSFFFKMNFFKINIFSSFFEFFHNKQMICAFWWSYIVLRYVSKCANSVLFFSFLLFFLLVLLAQKIDNDDVIVVVVNEISLDDIFELVKKILRDKCLRTDPRNDLDSSKDNLVQKNKNIFTC